MQIANVFEKEAVPLIGTLKMRMRICVGENFLFSFFFSALNMHSSLGIMFPFFELGAIKGEMEFLLIEDVAAEGMRQGRSDDGTGGEARTGLGAIVARCG